MIATVSATAIQLWFRVQAKRSQFRRRQTSSRLATFAEAFSSIGWAATAVLALTVPLAAIITALMTIDHPRRNLEDQPATQPGALLRSVLIAGAAMSKAPAAPLRQLAVKIDGTMRALFAFAFDFSVSRQAVKPRTRLSGIVRSDKP